MMEDFVKQETEYIKVHPDGKFDTFIVNFTGKLIGEWYLNLQPDSNTESAFIYFRECTATF
jgi:hypothetical protein